VGGTLKLHRQAQTSAVHQWVALSFKLQRQAQTSAVHQWVALSFKLHRKDTRIRQFPSNTKGKILNPQASFQDRARVVVWTSNMEGMA